MTRVVVRILAIVLLLGQLAQVSSAAFCSLPPRGQAAHCDDGMMQPAGASIAAPADGMAMALCNLMGPCGVPAPAVTAGSVIHTMVFADHQLAVAPAAIRPDSFQPTPVPPPPQA